jgi:hypothetical protein
MTDVAELAKSVWRTDPRFSNVDDAVWSVPVFDSDLSEQRRIVTATVKGLQVDFYQFYWADLMQGNRSLDVWKWLYALLQRRAETPAHLQAVRGLIMNIAAAVTVFGVAFALLTAVRLANIDLLSWSNFYAVQLALGAFVALWCLLRPAQRYIATFLGVSLIIASLLLGLFSIDLLYRQCQWVEYLQPPIANIGCPTSLHTMLFPKGTAGAVELLHSALAAVTFVALGATLFGLNRLSDSFLTPVMADSARLFTPSPDNIPNRDRIRKRGMELLEALHTSERRYDRIIMVAHSLGTVVAYNVLSQYWGNVYRLFDHPKTKTERQAVEAEAARIGQGATPQQPFAFRQAVRAYFRSLNTVKSALPEQDVEWRTADFVSTGQLLRRIRYGDLNIPASREVPDDAYRSPWRISDFITLGSPLSYGSFLLASSPEDFAEQKAIRRLPTCPPDAAPKRGDKPHHAALFLATCWTNIHFETSGLIKGDVIGGPVAPKFGPGVLDLCVKPGPSLPAFAHNEYWKTVDDPKPADALHIAVLRAAMNLCDHPLPNAGDDEIETLLIRPEISSRCEPASESSSSPGGTLEDEARAADDGM